MLDQTEKAYPARPDLTLENVDPNSSYAKVLELIGDARTVLDAGCATGYLARLLTERQCTVTGIDVNADALAQAAKYCARTIVADLDTRSLAEIVGDEKFDVIVFADVLEHVRDPWRVLDAARAILVDGGAVIASIPNIAHGATRLALLAGKFDYSEFGILDDTHLRFFTRRTVGELFVRSGFAIERIERTVLPLFAPSDLVPPLDPLSFDPATLESVRRDPECETLQFVVKGNALSDAAKWAQLSKSYVAVNRDLETADDRAFAQERAAAVAAHAFEMRVTANEDQLRAREHQIAGLEQQIRVHEERVAERERRLAALERESADLRALQSRAADEVARWRKSAVLHDETVAELNARYEESVAALAVAADQVEVLAAARVELERQCARLTAERDDGQARVLVAERTLHEYLYALADGFGNVGDAAARTASVAALRSAQPLLLAQIESLDAAVCAAAAERAAPRSEFKRLGVAARLAGLARRAVRRVAGRVIRAGAGR